VNILTNFETKEREHSYMRGAYTLFGTHLLRDANETGVEKKNPKFLRVCLMERAEN
jgi:hypothetical protein